MSTPKFVPRILSGMRPTGRMHLGHYFGALVNWKRLQDSGEYGMFLMSADWHALTTGYRDTSELRTFRDEMFADFADDGKLIGLEIL